MSHAPPSKNILPALMSVSVNHASQTIRTKTKVSVCKHGRMDASENSEHMKSAAVKRRNGTQWRTAVRFFCTVALPSDTCLRVQNKPAGVKEHTSNATAFI
jgi:hypothetical protein